MTAPGGEQPRHRCRIDRRDPVEARPVADADDPFHGSAKLEDTRAFRVTRRRSQRKASATKKPVRLLMWTAR